MRKRSIKIEKQMIFFFPKKQRNYCHLNKHLVITYCVQDTLFSRHLKIIKMNKSHFATKGMSN